MKYDRRKHAARSTDNYIFNQLIPYIGNKRKLLPLIDQAVTASGLQPGQVFVDLFSGSGVVARLAKTRGFRVVANDWEPYSEAINRAYIGCNAAPAFGARGYAGRLADLNALPPAAGWITDHLCPDDDEAYVIDRDRMFFMRKNGMRIDAIREAIAGLEMAGSIDLAERACLLAPLLYQCCYTSNTSGVFKGGTTMDDIAMRVVRGIPGSPMPANPTISAEDLWSTAAYVKSLANPGAPAAATGSQGTR